VDFLLVRERGTCCLPVQLGMWLVTGLDDDDTVLSLFAIAFRSLFVSDDRDAPDEFHVDGFLILLSNPFAVDEDKRISG